MVEEQLAGAAAHHVRPPQKKKKNPVSLCAPPTASVTFALCSSCRAF